MTTPKQRYFASKLSQAKTIVCACGCGEALLDTDNFARPRQFISGHNGRKYEGDEATRWGVQKRYRQNNPDKVRDAKREFYRARKLKAMALLGNRCSHCDVAYDGTNAPIFEFHHINPEEKDAGVTRMLSNIAWTKTVAELKKCILLCANCHNKFHGGAW